jgi:hypothetical protein
MEDFDPRLLAAAVKRRERELLKVCFDANDLDSRPTVKQKEIFGDIEKILTRWIIAGNQCQHPDFTDILMGDGTYKKLRLVEVGDIVTSYDLARKTLVRTRVLTVWKNPSKSLYKMQAGTKTLYITNDHKVFCEVEGELIKVISGKAEHFSIVSDGLEQSPVSSREYWGEGEAWDLEIDHPDHNYIANDILVSNSGKSSIPARELAWILEGTHPTWVRPKRWGKGSLLILIAGQSREIMETALWDAKLAPFLDCSKWEPKRASGSLMAMKHRENGNKIVFIPHGDGSETKSDNMQSYVAHYVWVDEMPKATRVLTELMQRTTSLGGYFIATFTPLAVNSEIKNIVDSADETYAKKYQMSKLDNPRFASPTEQARIMAEVAGLSRQERMTRLYGDWYSSDQAVYEFNRDTMCVKVLPPSYSRQWRHMEIVDPALSSRAGYVMAAEDPETKVWYLVRGDYIEYKQGRDPRAFGQEVWQRSQGYNIVRRASDVAPWFTAMMQAEYRYTYMQPWNKTQRKGELIKGLQLALSSGTLKLLDGACVLLIEELESCRWSETAEDKIVAGQRFHILDAAQYFIDCKPKSEGPIIPQQTIMDHIMAENDKRLKKQAVAAIRSKSRIRRHR